MRERILGGYDSFVLPFMIGVIFILTYLFIGMIRILIHIPGRDRKRLLLSLFNPKIIYKNIRDIICDCLIHVKIFKRKAILGYMHASIAFGWFMLIVIGHIEVALFVPQRNGILYYPVFYRYFTAEMNHTLRGAFFFFLMDFFLLIVLSGIGLAMYKRIHSIALGMRRTTRPSLADRVALYCLWAIFPLRLLAESFTAGISGGSFLTKPMYLLFNNFLSNNMHILPTWWAYSIVLGLFFLAMPFSRYMHIPTEAFLIVLRNAGLKVTKPRKGFAEAEIYSCSSCGLCIDACPMNVQKKNLKYSSVYFIRFLRRHNTRKINEIANKCLMCGKCVAICPVGVDSCGIRLAQRKTVTNKLPYNYNPIKADIPAKKGKVIYFAGCMTHLTPAIISSMKTIFNAAGEEYQFADEGGGVCCGRPLMLAGKTNAAQEIIEKNSKMIKNSGAETLILSCPICYKIFKEEYKLKNITILHHTEYIKSLLKRGKITLNRNNEKFAYHDPCDLGRGMGIYEEPRYILSEIGEVVKVEKERKESLCCGGSLGSLTLNNDDRTKITQKAVASLIEEKPEKIITACPLCMKTFTPHSPVPVEDIAKTVADNILK
jgi:Fe-S oxidoreductase